MSRSPRPSRKRDHGSPVRNVDGTSGDAKNGDQLQCTPNGPAGPPPSNEGKVIPEPPPVLPPLPMMLTELAMDVDVKVNLGAYEALEEKGSKGKFGDAAWKPSNEKLLTPQEAKTMWLEREVQSLKTVLQKVAEGSSYDISTAWSNCFGLLTYRINLCWNSLALSTVDKDEVIGLCMARCLEKNLNKLGHWMALCLEICLNKLGHCMATCLEKFLNKLMRCMALFLVIYLNVVGLCILAAVLAWVFNVMTLEGIFLVVRKGTDLCELVQCRLHGNQLEEEGPAAKPTCQSFHVELRHCNLAIGSTSMVPSCGIFQTLLDVGGI